MLQVISAGPLLRHNAAQPHRSDGANFEWLFATAQRLLKRQRFPLGCCYLTLWHGVNPPANREVLQGLVDQVNITHPPIQVESLYVGQGDQQIPKILTAIVGDVPPNLLWYAPTITGQLVDLDVIVPVED